MRRSWAALRSGVWDINQLLENWQMYVASQNQWRARHDEHYRVLSVDITGFWRPHLQGWLGKHYHNLAQRALPAVVVGVIIISGQVGSPRIPLLRRIVRGQQHASKPDFRSQLLREAVVQAASDQLIVVDAEFAIADGLTTPMKSGKALSDLVVMSQNHSLTGLISMSMFAQVETLHGDPS